ncbi:unnamed protein product [Aureobasidium pullulans]|nr:unnamed protein product [Aureobasidium pullulans]
MDLDQAPTDQPDQDVPTEATSPFLDHHSDSDSDAAPEQTSSKLSHPIRLVEQEMDEENKLALQAIKYLGGVGFFSKHVGST